MKDEAAAACKPQVSLLFRVVKAELLGMAPRILTLTILSLLHAAFISAAEPAKTVPKTTDDPKDTTVVLGPDFRVGPLTKDMTLLGLKTLFGKAMQTAELDGPEGTTLEGLKVHAGTERELHLVLEQEGDEKYATEAILVGKAWTFTNGLKEGMTVEELQKLNGKPFKLSGFDWDYGGFVTSFEGGALENAGVIIRFSPTGEGYSEKLSGDQTILSTNKLLKTAKAKVTGPLTVNLRTLK
jgi:hypothetical protein